MARIRHTDMAILAKISIATIEAGGFVVVGEVVLTGDFAFIGNLEEARSGLLNAVARCRFCCSASVRSLL